MQPLTPTVRALNIALTLCRRRHAQLARRVPTAPTPGADRARLALAELEQAIETIEALRVMARDAAERETCRTPFCPRGLPHDPAGKLCDGCAAQWSMG